MSHRALRFRVLVALSFAQAGCNLVLDIDPLPDSTDASTDGTGDDAEDVHTAPGEDAEAHHDATVGDERAPGEDATTGDEAADDARAGDALDAGADACSEAAAPCRCADLDNDKHNCGSCGHDCENGDCQFGHCQPFELVSGYAGILSLAVNGTDVFFTTESTGTLACSVDPAVCNNNPRTIGSSASTSGGLAVAGNRVFWSDDGNDLVTCPLAGCDGGTATVLVPNQGGMNNGVAADPARVYWAEQSNVFECATTGCGGVPTALTHATQTFPYGIAVQGGTLLWTVEGDFSPDGGAVVACATTGCTTPTVLAGGQNQPQAVASDGTTVYWLNVGSGDLWSCPAASCSAATATRLATQPGNAAAIALYDGGVYWANGEQPFYCPGSGCDGGTALGQSAQWTQAIAVDATGIYWVQGFTGNVMKLVH